MNNTIGPKKITADVDISPDNFFRLVPKVVTSDMLTFSPGDELPFDQMMIAVKNGYQIHINPRDSTGRQHV